jgi:protein-S-isoprenylcysteine O-methyltransferase Ste14
MCRLTSSALEAAVVSRTLIFIYGIVCYAISLVVFVYGMGFIVGLLTPTMLDGTPGRPLAQALGIDLGLIALFALQHSIMARPAFKRWWTRIVPEAAERSTYLLMSCVALGALFAFWAPIGGTVWQAPDGLARDALLGLYVFGWLLLLYTTFLIDHFDLFGLTQVWRRLTGRPYRAPQFHTPSLYKLVRHPLYIGWLTIFWAAPTMTISHLLFAVATTAYILLAIRFEERDLISAFGERYVTYRARTPMLVPRLTTRERAALVSESQAGD